MKPRNIVNFIIIGICHVFVGISLSLLAPFYPTVALSKGVSVTQSGLVFGSAFITTLIVTPLCGKYHHVAGGAKNFLLVGSFVIAIGNIGFGFVNRVNSSSKFMALSFFFRIIIALGEGAVESCVFSIAAQQGSKENRGKLMSVTEACFGAGQILGPSIGGALYQVGGFSAPFWICGGILLVHSLAAVFLFKDVSGDAYQTIDSHRTGWCQLLGVTAIPISLLILGVASIAFHWNLASLAQFLSAEYGLTAAQSGLIFLLFALCYTIFTPFFGFVMDRGLSGLVALIMGNFIITVGVIFVGPIPQLEVISGNLWLMALSIGLQGVGCASTFVGALIYMSTSAVEAGLPDSEQTQAMVSSLWIVAVFLGGYGGTSLGGLVFDQVGFRKGTLLESVIIAASVLFLLGVMTWRYFRSWNVKKAEDTRLNEEKKNLLSEDIRRPIS